MRTTLDIDSTVLQAAKEIAAAENTTAGAVISELARAGLNKDFAPADSEGLNERNEVEMLPLRDEPTSLQHVQRLMDEEGI